MGESIFGVKEEYAPTLYDIIRYSHNSGKQPLIGEESAFLTTFLSFNLMKLPVLIKSFSGTGKTILMDIILSLIPPAKLYSIQMGSNKSIWYEGDDINKASFIEFPELQKTVQNLDATEVLKNWGEQKSAKRTRADMIATVMSGTDQVKTTILKWKPFITSVAMENKDAKISQAEEFLRRVVRIHTDPTEKMTYRVVEYKLKAWAVPEKMVDMELAEQNSLQRFVYKLMNLPEVGFINPSAEALAEVIPKVFPISRSYIDYLKNIVNAVSKFHYKDRMRLKGDGCLIFDKIFVTPQDIWQAWKIYGTDFVESCLKIPVMGREVLSTFPDVVPKIDGTYVPSEGEMLTEGDVADKLKGLGLLIEKNKLRPVLVSLLYSCFLDRDESKKPFRYFRTTFSADTESVDWQSICERASEVMNREYEKFSEEFADRFLVSESLKVQNPLSGETEDMLHVANEDKKSIDLEEFE